MNDWADNWVQVYPEDAVQRALREMSYQIRQAHSDPEKPLVLIPILKGGLWTAYQLLNHLVCHIDQCPDIRIGHMGLSSYGDNQVPGKIKHTYTLDLDIGDFRDADVWLIDDIWDTGATMQAAFERCPPMSRSLNTAVLVYRYKMENVPRPALAGFVYTGSEFLAGCGMGVGELYRHHPEIRAKRKK